MKRYYIISLYLLLFSMAAAAQKPEWKIAGDKITTIWAHQVDTSAPLPEYPRPQMVRDNWKNLNGLWEYAITPASDTMPKIFQGRILVPFAPESALSGVNRHVGPGNILWYRTKFAVPPSSKGKNILLHFGAVDWSADIYINGIKVCSHRGGYDPFYINISAFLMRGDEQLLELRVTDPVDKGPQPRGKQVMKPGGIWYTSVTGIWRTVWLEAVPKTYITGSKQIPDIDKQTLTLTVNVESPATGDLVRISAWDGKGLISEKEAGVGTEITLPVTNPKLWSPENPFLYDLKIAIIRKGKKVDEVKSYFGMRKISLEKDEKDILRIYLNNSFLFQYGPLDQGWWPDGLYTAPTDEALAFDIIKTKEMGFNMIRKHVKVEPARWYYHCDRSGILVWQDMPSGDLTGGQWIPGPGVEGAKDKIRSEDSEKIYRTEWNSIIDYLYNFPCIVVWVPFNEAWGQFKTAEITRWTMEKDPSRLVNSASGGNFHDTGHILDMHNYPEPVMAKPELFGSKQALVLGEFGGLGLPVEDHTWLKKNNWGYQTFGDADTLFKAYDIYNSQLIPLIKRGLSAAVYTQTTDVEVETNGLMTYDRKVIKMPPEKLKEISRRLSVVIVPVIYR